MLVLLPVRSSECQSNVRAISVGANARMRSVDGATALLTGTRARCHRISSSCNIADTQCNSVSVEAVAVKMSVQRWKRRSHSCAASGSPPEGWRKRVVLLGCLGRGSKGHSGSMRSTINHLLHSVVFPLLTIKVEGVCAGQTRKACDNVKSDARTVVLAIYRCFNTTIQHG